MLSAAPCDVAVAAEATGAPQIARPQPAPSTPSTVSRPPTAVYDPTLAVGGDDLKARKIETRLSVNVFVDGRGPFQFIVDSGADTSAVGLRLASALQLPLGTPVILNGMTQRNVVDRVKVRQLSVGASSFDDLELPALRESDVGGDGLIGIDALVNQRLMMDFEKSLVKVEDARGRFPHERGEIVITAKRKRGQLILTHVRAAGYDLDAIIDTGSEITIGNLALRDKLIRGNYDKFATVEVTGVTGEKVNLQLARVGQLQLGPIALSDVPMAFADVPPFKMFGLSDQPALLLGTDLLNTFRSISLDFRSRKVRFQLRKCTDAAVISTDPDNATLLRSNNYDAACRR